MIDCLIWKGKDCSVQKNINALVCSTKYNFLEKCYLSETFFLLLEHGRNDDDSTPWTEPGLP